MIHAPTRCHPGRAAPDICPAKRDPGPIERLRVCMGPGSRSASLRYPSLGRDDRVLVTSKTFMISISKEFRFDAAHFLPTAEKGHTNARIHGHSFTAQVTLEGTPDPTQGWIRD